VRAYALVAVVEDRSHDAAHLPGFSLSGETNWDLMPRIIAGNLTFVANNARDFHKRLARTNCMPV
jgi:hypothetical protein